MEENREPGFYWVKLYGSTAWEIAEWDYANKWWLAGWELPCASSEMEQIDETKLERSK